MKKEVHTASRRRCVRADHRTLLSKALIGVLLIIATATLPLATLNEQVWGQIKDYLSLVFVPMVTLATTVITYYFANPRGCQSCDCQRGDSQPN